MGACTITIAVAGIQRWIVGGFTELKLIRGGSELLKDTFDDLAQFSADQGWEVVTATSGTLSVSVETDPEAAGEALARRFRETLPRVPAVLRYAREDGSTDVKRLTAAGAPPAVAVCAYSGEAGAVDADGDGHLRSAEIKQRLTAINSILNTPQLSFEMTEIGALTDGRFANYVGVLVADGDGIGKRVAEAWTSGRAAVRDLNRRLKRESDALVVEALEAGKARMGEEFLWNPVITGGDDITLVVPARSAPDVALALSSAPAVDGKPGMAASVAVFVCRASYPFHLAREAGEDILKNAKREARSLDEPLIGIRFEPGSIAAMSRWNFRQGPYTRSQFEAMWQWAQSEGKVSSSRLRHLTEAIETGGRTAEREWMLGTGPTDSCADPTGLRAVLSEFGSSQGPLGTDGQSPIGDLIDMRSLATTGAE